MYQFHLFNQHLERQPVRFRLKSFSIGFILCGSLLTATIVGGIIGIPILLLAGILLFIRSRIKTIEVECSQCQTKNAIEPKVTQFHCKGCFRHINEQETLIAKQGPIHS
ncbi:hypothetical protein [Kroppenstedtia eburnea]|uniref:Zinc-ribbon containing domain-containing protein n=1 Tax=Kroppenstedtia eburnea TaxID=714067 RepID=A0A1N7JFA0_9BACL|nr:hypothetical protein [Kroppenstedtia eburnea]QKI80605.1 hypothetical protein GXN75_00425 [Kroppenstedtia eburnea]SIS47934.1 hypothetical protein SAMN05421790_10216 [Kroppenstedtia eburnea]